MIEILRVDFALLITIGTFVLAIIVIGAEIYFAIKEFRNKKRKKTKRDNLQRH